jgi:hypothetical protein
MYGCRIKETAENCYLLGYYAVCSGNSLPTLGDNLSVPLSRVKNPRRLTTTRCVRTQKSAVLSYFTAEAWNYARKQPLKMVSIKADAMAAYVKNCVSGNNLLCNLTLSLLSSSSSLSPLCRVYIYIYIPIFLKQTTSLGNTLLQLFSSYCLWCLYLQFLRWL